VSVGIPFRSSSQGGEAGATHRRHRCARVAAARVERQRPAAAGPALTAPILRELPRHTVVQIDGAVRDWYRVQLPDGTAGFVSERLTESTGQPLRTARAGAVQLLDRPMVTAAPIADLEAHAPLSVLGRFGDFLFVRTRADREGWILQ
jgi:hypothetical protein